jgi:hypothetical protein
MAQRRRKQRKQQDARDKAQAAAQGRRAVLQSVEEIKRQAQRDRLVRQRELHGLIQEKYRALVEQGVPVQREILAVMAHQEALVDALCEAGAIDRVVFNCRRFEYLLDYLTKLEPAQSEAVAS